ncbi:MAG: hypothetical protein WCA44_04405 [Acidobacteriaceae bacterium]|jgi:hypothetical protein
MKYIVFEEAAVEASAGLQEVDEELEQLVARTQVLESKKQLLDTLVHQLMMVLPAGHRECSSELVDDAAALPESPASKLFPVISGGQDPKWKDEKLKDEWAAFVQRSTAAALGSQ